ncbi:YceI family protein [uncultured Bacteroides sp.]|uniref:YceI family protein n=1 Tax=uncultured Bacteroides sp. TaxID=162156 RepID=UPI002AAC2807|nr:YceI family protein [uncultured Bacteroides sp.]
MKKFFLSFMMMVALSVTGSAQQSWTNDPAHSRLGFTVKHMTISEVSGRFTDFTVKVKSAKKDLSDLKVEVTANIASINTDMEARDKHLKGTDFFDTEKYPTLTFVSTSHKKVTNKNFKLMGNLTMHGITKFVTLDVIFLGEVTNPMNQKKVSGFKVTGVVKRSNYDLGTKFGEAMISNNVKIVADLEFIKD